MRIAFDFIYNSLLLELFVLSGREKTFGLANSGPRKKLSDSKDGKMDFLRGLWSVCH